MKSLNKRYENWIMLSFLSLLFLATRLFRLKVVPFGAHVMHIDEIGAAYDAFCISNFGVDQYLYKFPVYFKCFGEGQNALYTYLAAIVFKIAGISIFKFRLVAVACAFAAFISLYFLGKRLMTETYALVAMALMISMPVFMMSEHWGLECYLFLSFAMIAMSLTIKAAADKNSGWYLAAGIAWGLTLYNYAITYVTIPPFIVLTVIYLLYLRKADLKEAVLFVSPVVLLGIPLLIQQLVMMGVIPPFTFLGIIDFWKPEYYRYGSISITNLWSNIRTSSFIALGSDFISYNSNEWFGTIYYISIPFVFIGLAAVIKKTIVSVRTRTYDAWSIVFLYYLSARIVILFVTRPNVNRVNGLYLAYLLFTVLGIKLAVEKVNKKWFSVIIAASYLVLFITFSYFYFTYLGYNDGHYRTHLDFTEGDVVDTQPGEAIRMAKNIAGGREVYALMNNGWYTDYAIALFSETPPYDYSNDEDYENDSYNGAKWQLPEELDLTGKVVYVIDNDLQHITDYLASEGFNCDSTFDEYKIVYK